MAYKDIKPYGDLAHIASLNGGPEKYIHDIELNGFMKGLSKGRLEGIGIGGCGLALLLGVGYVGKVLWDKCQAKKEETKEIEENAKIAKIRLMENAKKNNADEEHA